MRDCSHGVGNQELLAADELVIVLGEVDEGEVEWFGVEQGFEPPLQHRQAPAILHPPLRQNHVARIGDSLSELGGFAGRTGRFEALEGTKFLGNEQIDADGGSPLVVGVGDDFGQLRAQVDKRFAQLVEGLLVEPDEDDIGLGRSAAAIEEAAVEHPVLETAEERRMAEEPDNQRAGKADPDAAKRRPGQESTQGWERSCGGHTPHSPIRMNGAQYSGGLPAAIICNLAWRNASAAARPCWN